METLKKHYRIILLCIFVLTIVALLFNYTTYKSTIRGGVENRIDLGSAFAQLFENRAITNLGTGSFFAVVLFVAPITSLVYLLINFKKEWEQSNYVFMGSIALAGVVVPIVYHLLINKDFASVYSKYAKQVVRLEPGFGAILTMLLFSVAVALTIVMFVQQQKLAPATQQSNENAADTQQAAQQASVETNAEQQTSTAQTAEFKHQFCANCGSAFQGDDAFCGSCGAKRD